MSPPAAAALLLALLANLLWGSSLVAGKVALQSLTPLQVTAWRMIAAGLLVLPWLLHRLRGNGHHGPLPAPAWAAVAGAGLLGFAASKLLMMWGLHRTTAAESALLISVEPLFTIALGRIALGEALGPRRLVSFVLGAAGAWLLVARGIRPPALAEAHVVGALAILLGLAAEAGCSVLGKTLVRNHAAAVVTAAMIAATLGVWIPVALADTALNGPPPLAAVPAAAVVYLALGCTVVPYWLWFRALARLEAGRVALTLFTQPVWGAALGVALLGEPLRPATAAGGALVLASLYLALRDPPAHKPEPAAG